jgi:hypothetical protein
VRSSTLYFLLTALALSGCNIFDPFDSPTSDAQLESVGIACFNRGDIACAQENFGKLSTAASDIKNSEDAFVAIDAINAGMASFIAAFGQKSNNNNGGGGGNLQTGIAVTSVANSIGVHGSQASRVAAFNAFKQADLVNEIHLRGLSRFVTSLAVAAEMLDETAASPGNLLPGDLAANATTCLNSGTAGCAAAAGCVAGAKPIALTGATVQTVGGTQNLSGVALTDVNVASLSLEVFNAAIQTISDSLVQMGVTSTNANVSGFAGTLTNIPGAAAAYEHCYREGLLAQGIGQ